MRHAGREDRPVRLRRRERRLKQQHASSLNPLFPASAKVCARPHGPSRPPFTPSGRWYSPQTNVAKKSGRYRAAIREVWRRRMPDGPAVDVEGHVWAATNSQGKLVRLSPAGEVTATCVVPSTKMTSCPGFNEKDMKILFPTSIAADGSTGNVYRARVDVAGIDRHSFKF